MNSDGGGCSNTGSSCRAVQAQQLPVGRVGFSLNLCRIFSFFSFPLPPFPPPLFPFLSFFSFYFFPFFLFLLLFPASPPLLPTFFSFPFLPFFPPSCLVLTNKVFRPKAARAFSEGRCEARRAVAPGPGRRGSAGAVPRGLRAERPRTLPGAAPRRRREPRRAQRSCLACLPASLPPSVLPAASGCRRAAA